MWMEYKYPAILNNWLFCIVEKPVQLVICTYYALYLLFLLDILVCSNA